MGDLVSLRVPPAILELPILPFPVLWPLSPIFRRLLRQSVKFSPSSFRASRAARRVVSPLVVRSSRRAVRRSSFVVRRAVFLPRLSRRPTTPPTLFPRPSPANFGESTKSPNDHLSVDRGLTQRSKKHPRRNCGLFGDFCRPAALWSSEKLSHNCPRLAWLFTKS